MPLVVCVAVLAIGYLAYTTSRYVIHNYQLHQDEAQIRRDIAQLDSDHAQLVAVRDYLKSDEYVEDVARRILGLVRPGETLVVVSGAPLHGESSTAAGTTPGPLGQHTPGAEWWKDLFTKPQPTPTP
jgi:cell division protein FtsB